MPSSPWDDLADALAAVCGQFDRDRLAHVGTVAGSAAALEASGEPHADEWGDKPGHSASMAGHFLALIALDNLACLASLLRPAENHVFGPIAPARSAMEAAARAHYLLEPGITPIERIRRHQNERLVALTEGRRFARLAPEPDETTDRLSEQASAIFRSAGRHGLTAYRHANPRPYLSPKPPTATRLIDDAVDRGDGLGAIYYQVMSAAAQGREHGITQYFTRAAVSPDQDHGDVFGSIETDPKKTAQYAGGCPVAVAHMLVRLYSHFGWPATEMEPAVSKMRAAWEGTAQA